LRREAQSALAAAAAAHPRLAGQVLAWQEARDRPGDDNRSEQLRAVLRAEHERLLAEQTRAVLAAPRTAAGDPQAFAAAAALQSGRLQLPVHRADVPAPEHQPLPQPVVQRASRPNGSLGPA
jgi:hypothetical protein